MYTRRILLAELMVVDIFFAMQSKCTINALESLTLQKGRQGAVCLTSLPVGNFRARL
jgi:hypothetical protein